MGPPVGACILCKHAVWEIHPREKPSQLNLWSKSQSRQFAPSQENGQVFKRSLEREK